MIQSNDLSVLEATITLMKKSGVQKLQVDNVIIELSPYAAIQQTIDNVEQYPEQKSSTRTLIDEADNSVDDALLYYSTNTGT